MFGTIEDLETILAAKFNVSSSPTRAQATAIMETHSDVLTVLMRARGVPVPDTGTSAYRYLTRIVLLRTAADILRRRAMEAGEASSPLAESLDQKANDLLELALNAPQGMIET